MEKFDSPFPAPSLHSSHPAIPHIQTYRHWIRYRRTCWLDCEYSVSIPIGDILPQQIDGWLDGDLEVVKFGQPLISIAVSLTELII